MGQPLDLEDLKRRFEAHPAAFTGNSLLLHIPGEFKRVGEYPKKIKDKMPMDKFKNYFVKTIYGAHKVVGKDGSDEVWGEEYKIAKDVQDAFHACEYDYVSHILDIMKENIARARSREMKSSPSLITPY